MIWLLAIVAAAFAFGSSSAPPPPDTGTRCPEIVLDDAWMEANKSRLIAAVTDFMRDRTELATTALLRVMPTLFPDCEWTPSTTTELVIAEGRVRFDEIMRRLQGVAVGDAGSLLTQLGLPPEETVEDDPRLPPFPTEGTSPT